MLRILTTLYNARKYLHKCVGSIRGQSERRFHCYILDDISTDGSYELALGLVRRDSRFTVVRNGRKQWQPGNYQQIIQREEVHDEDICITVDGDDWLPDKEVFARIWKTYEDPNVWITWGAFWHLRHGKMHDGLSCAVEDVTKQRAATWHTSHLRTWRAFLWRAIEDEDLRAPNGNYWETTGDLAFMYPMLEMATNAHARYLPEYNYVYNHDNPLCDSASRGGLQKHYEDLIRNKPPYAPLERVR